MGFISAIKEQVKLSLYTVEYTHEIFRAGDRIIELIGDRGRNISNKTKFNATIALSVILFYYACIDSVILKNFDDAKILDLISHNLRNEMLSLSEVAKDKDDFTEIQGILDKKLQKMPRYPGNVLAAIIFHQQFVNFTKVAAEKNRES